MSVEARLHDFAHQVEHLLGCESACLVLGCPEPGLHHPLLDLFPSITTHFIGYYGSTSLSSLLDEECVRALCDVALQTGQAQSINHCRLDAGGIAIQCVAVAPIDHPVGLLGFFLLINPFTGGFYQGEHHLLDEYLHTIAQAVEDEVRNLYATLLYVTLTNPGNNVCQPVMTGMQPGARQNELGHLKNEFVSMVSHELRTPLTAIKGYAGLLQAYSVPDRLNGNRIGVEMTPARQQQYLDIIMEQTKHLEVLIGDLLDISRISAGRLALHFTRVNVALLCQQVTRIAQHRVDQQQSGTFHIRCLLDPDLPFIWADPDRVQQVLTNVLENAIKYSPNGGLIEIVAYTEHSLHSSRGQSFPASQTASEQAELQEPDVMHITVRDQGIGISDQHYSLLFQPFSRLEGSINDQVPGTGLGLYITRKLLEAMGGEIALSSLEGQGTSMTITLPLARSDKAFTSQIDAVPLSMGVK